MSKKKIKKLCSSLNSREAYPPWRFKFFEKKPNLMHPTAQCPAVKSCVGVPSCFGPHTSHYSNLWIREVSFWSYVICMLQNSASNHQWKKSFLLNLFKFTYIRTCTHTQCWAQSTLLRVNYASFSRSGMWQVFFCYHKAVILNSVQ